MSEPKDRTNSEGDAAEEVTPDAAAEETGPAAEATLESPEADSMPIIAAEIVPTGPGVTEVTAVTDPAGGDEPTAAIVTEMIPAAVVVTEVVPIAAEAAEPVADRPAVQDLDSAALAVGGTAIGAKQVAKGTRTARPRTRPVVAETDRPKPAATPYAVIETGGKQYRVRVGESLAVERLTAEAGSDLTLDRVLLVGGAGTTRVGTPVVSGATVTARVEDHYRGEKIVTFKYKPKKRYRRRTGHRQSLTRLTITGIDG